MRINFRQGLVSSEMDGNGQPNYLYANGTGIALRATNRPTIFSVASGTKNYTVTFHQDVLGWPTSMLSGVTEGWLWIDINRATSARSYGVTTTEPSYSTVAPSSPVDGQHWFDRSKNVMKAFNGVTNSWITVIRVFAGHYTTTQLSTYPVGSQVGITGGQYLSGNIMVDGFGVALTDSTGAFVTTEETVYVDGAPTYAAKLEANVTVVSAGQNIAAFHVVSMTDEGLALPADYDDTGDKIVGLAVVDAVITEPVNIVLSGKVYNPLWNWGSANVTLWIGTNGELVAVDPFTVGGRAKARVPVARTIDAHTIIFDQGLGGKGEKGDAGDLTGLVNAAANVIGITKLSVDPDDFENPIAVGINDPLLTAPRVPLEHTHPATAITVSPFGTFSGSNAQQAFEHLQTVKLNLSGGTVTGNITSTVLATQDNHLATLGQTKQTVTAAAVIYKRFTLSSSASTIVQAFNTLSASDRTYVINTVVVCEWKQSVYFWAGGYGSPVSATDTSQFLLIGKLAGDVQPLSFRVLEGIAAYQGATTKSIAVVMSSDNGEVMNLYALDSITGDMTQLDTNDVPLSNGQIELSTDNDQLAVYRTDWSFSPPHSSVQMYSYPTLEAGANMTMSGGGIQLNNIGIARLSKDGSRIAITHNDAVGDITITAATVYDTATGQVLFYVPAAQNWDTSQNTIQLAISPDGSKLAVRYNTTVYANGQANFDFALFDINTTQEIVRYSGFRCVDVAFNQDGSKVAFLGAPSNINSNKQLSLYVIDANNPPLTSPTATAYIDSDWSINIWPTCLNVEGTDFFVAQAYNDVTDKGGFVYVNMTTGEYHMMAPETANRNYGNVMGRWDNRLYGNVYDTSSTYSAIVEIDTSTWGIGSFVKDLVPVGSTDETYFEYMGVS